MNPQTKAYLKQGSSLLVVAVSPLWFIFLFFKSFHTLKTVKGIFSAAFFSPLTAQRLGKSRLFWDALGTIVGGLVVISLLVATSFMAGGVLGVLGLQIFPLLFALAGIMMGVKFLFSAVAYVQILLVIQKTSSDSIKLAAQQYTEAAASRIVRELSDMSVSVGPEMNAEMAAEAVAKAAVQIVENMNATNEPLVCIRAAEAIAKVAIATAKNINSKMDPKLAVQKVTETAVNSVSEAVNTAMSKASSRELAKAAAAQSRNKVKPASILSLSFLVGYIIQFLCSLFLGAEVVQNLFKKLPSSPKASSSTQSTLITTKSMQSSSRKNSASSTVELLARTSSNKSSTLASIKASRVEDSISTTTSELEPTDNPTPPGSRRGSFTEDDSINQNKEEGLALSSSALKLTSLNTPEKPLASPLVQSRPVFKSSTAIMNGAFLNNPRPVAPTSPATHMHLSIQHNNTALNIFRYGSDLNYSLDNDAPKQLAQLITEKPVHAVSLRNALYARAITISEQDHLTPGVKQEQLRTLGKQINEIQKNYKENPINNGKSLDLSEGVEKHILSFEQKHKLNINITPPTEDIPQTMSFGRP